MTRRPLPPGSPLDVDRQRRRLLQAGLGGLVASLPGYGLAAGTTPPNILMIAVDDLNDWVGFLGGHPQVQTPGMDRLAARSSVFTRAYCNFPLCNPSRASALSGLAVRDTHVYDNNTSIRNANPSAVDFPAWLGSHGYETKLWGKIFHWFAVGSQPVPDDSETPLYNQLCSGKESGTPAIGLFDWGGLDADDSAYPDWQWSQNVINYLGQDHAKPFFVGLGLLRTHLPWYVPKRFFDLYPEDQVQVPPAPPGDLDDIPPAGRATALQLNAHNCITKQDLWASAVRGYLASISFADSQVARVLAALEQSRYANDTLVILWSDHGYHLGEKFHWHKSALWERCTRVPFLIHRPGQLHRRVIDAPVSLLDLFPTVLDFAGGIAAPYPLAGRSLRRLMRKPDMPWSHPVLTTNMISADRHDYAIRTRRWRYIRYANGDRELYDHAHDPNEWTNLAGDPAQSERMAQLDALMPALGT